MYTLGYTATIQALGGVTEALVGPPVHGWEALPDTVEGVLAGSAAIVSRSPIGWGCLGQWTAWEAALTPPPPAKAPSC